MKNIKFQFRRNFLKFLATSPLLGSFRGISSCCQEISVQGGLTPDASQSSRLISAVEEALNVFDFKAVAQGNQSLIYCQSLITK
jgi:hypothetical protein